MNLGRENRQLIMQSSKDFAQKRKKHLARQARSDALKTLRAGESVWITVPDFDNGGIARCRVMPIPYGASFEGGKKTLCLLRNKLQAAIIVEKDGIRVYNIQYHIQMKKLFGLVVESHPISA